MKLAEILLLVGEFTLMFVGAFIFGAYVNQELAGYWFIGIFMLMAAINPDTMRYLRKRFHGAKW